MDIIDALKKWKKRRTDPCDTQIEYRDLAPTDQIENGDEYMKALHWALNESRIKNIALAGPYGSGKSSIIESYLRNNKGKKYLRISMATFIENADEEAIATNSNNNRTRIPSGRIEEGILKQLFYKVDHKRIPQSRYRKLHRVGFWKCYIWLAVIAAVALSALYVFWPESSSFLVNRIVDAGTRLKVNESWSKILAFIAMFLLTGAAAYGVRHLFSRYQIKEAKIPGADATVGAQSVNSDSVFDKNMDEIILFYFYGREKTAMKITEISIKNFRSFDERGASIVVGEMAAFVGKNSSGKSNILQALQLFWGQYALTAEDFYYGETDRTISISVTFEVASGEIVPVLLPYASPDGLLQLRHDYTEADQKGKLYSCGKNKYTGQSDMNPFPERKLTSEKISSFLASEQSASLHTYA